MTAISNIRDVLQAARANRPAPPIAVRSSALTQPFAGTNEVAWSFGVEPPEDPPMDLFGRLAAQLPPGLASGERLQLLLEALLEEYYAWAERQGRHVSRLQQVLLEHTRAGKPTALLTQLINDEQQRLKMILDFIDGMFKAITKAIDEQDKRVMKAAEMIGK
jgi:hypothetical protein